MRLKYSAAAGLAIILAAGSVAHAQITAGEPSQKPKAERPARAAGIPGSGAVEAFAKQLGLSDEQKSKVQTVVTNYRAGAKDIILNASLKADEQKAKVEELRSKSELEIRAILTAQQSEQAQKDDSIKKLLAVGPGRPSNKELADALKLSDDQKQKLTAITKEQKAKQKEIAQNTSLTDEARKDQLKALRQDTQKQIEALLTLEQKSKYMELTNSRFGQDKDQAKAKNRGQGKRKGHGKKNAAEAEQPAQQ